MKKDMVSFEEQLRKDCPALFKLHEMGGIPNPQGPGSMPGQQVRPPMPPTDDGMINRALMHVTGGNKELVDDTLNFLFSNTELLGKIVKMAQQAKMKGGMR
jgi:hypothetical protein